MYVVEDGSLAVFVLLQREMTLGSPLLIPYRSPRDSQYRIDSIRDVTFVSVQ